jgi:hypothetical protein
VGRLTQVIVACFYLYLQPKEQAFILVGTVEDSIRAVTVIMDYATTLII